MGEKKDSRTKYKPNILLLEPIVIKLSCQNAEKVSSHSLQKVLWLLHCRQVTVGGLVPVHEPGVPLSYSLAPTLVCFLRWSVPFLICPCLVMYVLLFLRIKKPTLISKNDL